MNPLDHTAAPPGGEDLSVPCGFPIVGMGASAGGLEAFEQFFRQVRPDSGMAYVLVPHLDPGHASLLTEILQRSTSLPVVEAEDQVPVAPNHVYIIPPNRDMGIFHGALQLSLPELPRGQRMTIDAFFRSLAEDQGDRAIGIILSGTGTDGTLGLRAILGNGGFSLVQEPTTAKFDGMPASAIQAGYATQILPVEKMPQALQTGLHRLLIPFELPPDPAAMSGMTRILALLRSHTGHDFSLYKKNTIVRRIERRMLQHDIADPTVYVRYLKEQPAELKILFRELLINVTQFFRDPAAFVAIQQEILPRLCADRPEGAPFRAWVAGCASGEEAYSLAMLLREFMDETQQDFKVQIYATDLDDEAIAVARAGVYPPNIAQDVEPERLRRFFSKEEAGYHVKKTLREMVVFAIQNVIKDPPFTRLDLLCCRNLMIYLEPALQSRLIPMFHYALKPDGVLFLSPSESIGNHTELFAAQNRSWKLYRALHSRGSTQGILTDRLPWVANSGVKAPHEVMNKPKVTNFSELARRALLQFYAPASVVTDPLGNLLYVHGDTGPYLRPAPGQATLNVVDMACDGLALALRAALQAATNQGVPTLNQTVSVKIGGHFQTVRLSVRPLPAPDADEGLLISFQAAERAQLAPPARARRSQRINRLSAHSRIAELERELIYRQENLQATLEAYQASNEELQSTNEEMQSTNEEVQSTNEELETSREELQSVNEELQTVNAELQAKIEQLINMQNDMKNLLENTYMGTIFLDERLVIRRFTREASRVYCLVATDVGRPLANIKSNLEGEDLLAVAHTVLETLLPSEREIRTLEGLWYLARIRPYRTLDNVIMGVVMTFTDISALVKAKTAKAEAERVMRELAEAIVNTVREPLLVLNGALQVVTASRSFYRDFQVIPEDTLGRLIYDLGNRQWDIPALRELLEDILPRNQSFEGYRVEHDFPGIGRRQLLLNGRRLIAKADDPPLILLAMETIPTDAGQAL
ncbi:MAG: chemotaxis protein CheB [Pseudomonadota bacterium]